jgi:hypothetical protein
MTTNARGRGHGRGKQLITSEDNSGTQRVPALRSRRGTRQQRRPTTRPMQQNKRQTYNQHVAADPLRHLSTLLLPEVVRKLATESGQIYGTSAKQLSGDRLTAIVRYARTECSAGFLKSPLPALNRTNFFKFTMTQASRTLREWLHMSVSCATKLKPRKERATPCPVIHSTQTIHPCPSNGNIALNKN